MSAPAAADHRLHSHVELDAERVSDMLAPLLVGRAVAEVVRLDGGLVNTLFRVTLVDDTRLALRVHVGGMDAFERERRVLAALTGRVVVPHVLLTNASLERCDHPYLAYDWIDGITLNECRREHGQQALLQLAESLGDVLARIAACAVGGLGAIEVASRLTQALCRLEQGRARARLGANVADALRARLHREKSTLRELERHAGFLHGDFSGRNTLARNEEGRWSVSGIVDWESASSGCVLWDVGSLFRYSARYSGAFADLFERGYRAAGGTLPDGWRRAARLLDATRLVAILDEDRELSDVFSECRELIDALLDE